MNFEALGPINNHFWQFKALLLERATLRGDIAEFGVFNGGSTRQLAGLAPGRTIYAFDTYEGMPSEEFSRERGDHDEPGKFKPDASVEKMFEGFSNIVPIKGRFAETLASQYAAGLKFALVYMDCDLYESYRQVLSWLENDHLYTGTALVFDDYEDCKGATTAIDEWVAKHNLLFDKANRYVCWGHTNPLPVAPDTKEGI